MNVWNWLANHGWTPETFVTLLAVLVAGGAYSLSSKAHRASYQPVLRVVPTRLAAGINPDALILKNIGRGAAMAIVIVTGRGSSAESMIAEVDALETLGELYGPHFQERSRVGRRTVPLQRNLVAGGSYRAFYQDTAGGWHETEFSVLADAFRVRILGERQLEEVPPWIRERAQIVSGF